VTDTSHEDIRQIARSFVDAWNQRKIPMMAPLLTDDVQLVNALGLWWHGSAEVLRGLEAMNAFGASITPDVMSVREVAPGAAICGFTCTVSSFVGRTGDDDPNRRR
jgi:uncharacterized protein (TIGR02246 family)